MRKIMIVAAMAGLAACASTSDPGWTGSGAEPFGAAQTQCEQQTQGQGQAAFEACMASRGWRRGGQ